MPQYDDKTKKKAIAMYVECGSYRKVARKFKVSDATVKKWCESKADFKQKCAEKKAENSKSILDYMDSKAEDVKDIIGLLLQDLKDEGKRKRAGLMQTATTLGIVIDKFTAVREDMKDSETEGGVIVLTKVEAENE